MIELAIPGYKKLQLHDLLMDFNGTLACDGRMSNETILLLEKVAQNLRIHIATAGTHGGTEALSALNFLQLYKINPGQEAEQKREILRSIGAQTCAAAGNGANDILMLQEAALAVAVIGEEGCYPKLIHEASIIVTSPESLLRLFAAPKRIIATLRR